jgi:hypothetical protein
VEAEETTHNHEEEGEEGEGEPTSGGGGSYECQSMRTRAVGCAALVIQLLTGT